MWTSRRAGACAFIGPDRARPASGSGALDSVHTSAEARKPPRGKSKHLLIEMAASKASFRSSGPAIENESRTTGSSTTQQDVFATDAWTGGALAEMGWKQAVSCVGHGRGTVRTAARSEARVCGYFVTFLFTF